jgi:hypothetical protein
MCQKTNVVSKNHKGDYRVTGASTMKRRYYKICQECGSVVLDDREPCKSCGADDFKRRKSWLFTKGDLVTVKTFSEIKNIDVGCLWWDDIDPGWDSDMESYCGSDSQIVRSNNNEQYYISIDGQRYWWSPFWLTAKSPDIVELQTCLDDGLFDI